MQNKISFFLEDKEWKISKDTLVVTGSSIGRCIVFVKQTAVNAGQLKYPGVYIFLINEQTILEVIENG